MSEDCAIGRFYACDLASWLELEQVEQLMMNDVSHETTTPLAPRIFRLHQAITIWIQEKANRTRSAEAKRAYTSRLEEFRAVLRAAGLDLDRDPQLVAVAAQGWADHPDRVDGHGKPVPVAPATYNQ